MDNANRFDINKYTDVRYVMICDNEYDDESFRRYLDSVGRKWCTGKSYLEGAYYCPGETIAYLFNRNQYSKGDDRDNAISRGWALYYKDFQWDDDIEDIDPSDAEELNNFLKQFEVK